LTDVITPKSLLEQIIHGHTDAIGEETYNQISLARANDVKNIENSLSKAGRNDVKFELNGFENENESPLKIKLRRTILQ
jgi:outer membrane protein OmpA-like peptidoglycan-associated protein